MATTSPRKAIALHCKDCIYDSHCSGNWRQQVEACTISDCPLYDHRPITGHTARLQRENHLATLTPHEREIVLKRSIKRALNLANVRDGTVEAQP